MTTPKHVSGTIKADARAALEELANMSLGIQLEDWCRLSSSILAAIQPDPEPVIEDADMKRCAGCGSVRDRRGMDCLEDGSWRCCDCIKSKPVVDGLIAMNACLVQLDMLVAESGRGVEWGEEDAFRMGEWFEDADLANIERTKAFVAGLSRDTPSIAGTVSVEAAARVLLVAQEAYFDGEGGSDSLGSLDTEALSALAGDNP